jgi:LacI family transcriptional regulator
MAIRAKDIAKKIGVSEATLSLVVNGKPGISAATRAKVEKMLRDMDYGFMLKENQTQGVDNRVIGFVLFKDNGELLGVNSFFPYILSGVESTARRYNYTLTVINIEKRNLPTEIGYITASGCTGFVIFATEMKEEDLDAFESLNLPFVIFDNEFSMREINCVKVNNRQGTATAVEFLIKNGHRRIGYLSSGLDINSFIERRECADWALKRFDAENMQDYYYDIGYPNVVAEANMKKLLENKSKQELPTAFLADNDLVIAGAMLAMKDVGYRIPDDFSLIGFDDRPICTLMEPKLTTIMIPRVLFGSTAVSQLVRMLKGREEGCVTVKVNGKLIKRGTVKAIS